MNQWFKFEPTVGGFNSFEVPLQPKEYGIEGRYKWLYMLCRRYSIRIRNIQLLYTRYLYIRQIFLIQMEYRLQSMYINIVMRAASFVSPFYSILLGHTQCIYILTSDKHRVYLWTDILRLGAQQLDLVSISLSLSALVCTSTSSLLHISLE